MIVEKYGNLLESGAQCLVNAVNCEGFMGKGIAFQFKQKFPQNNKYYIQQCKQHLCTTGQVLFFEEKKIIIANFPTKNKWREKSKYEYIERGLQSLYQGVVKHEITSLAIPQLGCGNGGLEWEKIRKIIFDLLEPLQNVQITLYKTLEVFNIKNANLSHLLLIYFKNHLHHFRKTRLQKACFFYTILSGSKHFNFQPYKFGPYSHEITRLSNQIKNSTQPKQNFKTLESDLYRHLMSSSVDRALKYAEKIVQVFNQIDRDFDIEIYATLLHIISLWNGSISYQDICWKFSQYPKHEIERFKNVDFLSYLKDLQNFNFIKQDILGYYTLY